MKIKKIIAVLAGCSMLTGTLPVQAAYQSPEEVTLSVRAMSGGIIPEDNPHQIYVSPEDAAQGTTLHFGLFFETDPSIVDIAFTKVILECEGASFVESSVHTPSETIYPEGKEFTHTDGTIFTTKFQPYCFGRINNMGRYEHGSTFCTANVKEHLLNYTWYYDLNNQDENGKKLFTAKFFGNNSDDYSFLEFDMEISPNTPAGTYPVKFIVNDDDISESTYLTSDDSYPDEENPPYYISVNSNLIPALQSAEIIVEGSSSAPVLESPLPVAFRNAEDTTPFSLSDFPEELTISDNGVSKTFKTEDLVEVFETGSPSSLVMSEPVEILRSELMLNGKPVLDKDGNPAVLEYHIAHKGDTNFDGLVNAKDASLILVYSADTGAKKQAFLTDSHDETEENLAYAVSDIDSDENLNAQDAGKVLIYSALLGSKKNPDWKDIS